MKVKVSSRIVEETLRELQYNGRKSKERMILWLGKRGGDEINVKEIFIPRQKNSKISIRIEQIGMNQIFSKLRNSGLMVAVQIHSHPDYAFHSYSDDILSIIRHEGGISLVIPNFGLRTTASSFLRDAKCYELSRNDVWEESIYEDCIELKES